MQTRQDPRPLRVETQSLDSITLGFELRQHRYSDLSGKGRERKQEGGDQEKFSIDVRETTSERETEIWGPFSAVSSF